MEPKKPKKNNSDKNLPKIVYKEEKKEPKEEVKITRTKHKSKQ